MRVSHRMFLGAVPEFDKTEHKKLSELIREARKLREETERLIEKSESLRAAIENKGGKTPKNKKL